MEIWGSGIVIIVKCKLWKVKVGIVEMVLSKLGIGNLELWKSEIEELFNSGIVEIWNCGYLELWKSGTAEIWNCGNLDLWKCRLVEIWIFGIP